MVGIRETGGLCSVMREAPCIIDDGELARTIYCTSSSVGGRGTLIVGGWEDHQIIIRVA